MNVVTLDHVCEALSAWTGIPADRLRPGGMMIKDPDTLGSILRETVVGQEPAIDTAVWALTRRTALPFRAEERRPIWTALFVGPSGVGKTQLAKELARTFFGDADRHLVHIDLSDFRDEHTVARLVGAPPGYKGHGDGGELTNALRRTTTGVLLFDEVEKAHPAVVTQVLLPLLGDGAIHDMNDGRVLSASQFLVVMTSNLGTNRAGAPAGFATEVHDDPAKRVRLAVAEHFSRELLGRIDDVVVFDLLSEDALRQLWTREVLSLSERLSAGRKIDLHVDEQVQTQLLRSHEARTASEGARALRKLVDRAIADPSIRLLGDAESGGRIHVAPAEGGGLRFRFEPGPTALGA